jgi:hypothetical protein
VNLWNHVDKFIGSCQLTHVRLKKVFKNTIIFFKEWYGFNSNCLYLLSFLIYNYKKNKVKTIIMFFNLKQKLLVFVYLLRASRFNSPPYLEPLPTSSIISGILLANIAYKIWFLYCVIILCCYVRKDLRWFFLNF